MGTSRSGSVGSGTRWRVTRDDLKALSDAVSTSVPRSIPQVELSGKKKKPRSVPSEGGGPRGGGDDRSKGVRSIPQVATGLPAPRTLRALGKQLVASGSVDRRFDLQLGDCAVKVAIELLVGLVTTATLKHRTQRDTEKLFAEYGISGGRSAANALAKALEERYREEFVKTCKKATDSFEKARLAMQPTLIDILSPDGTPGAFIKLNAEAIHAALRRTNSMKIVEHFYANYIYHSMKLLVSSINADITPAARDTIVDGLRPTYCDYKAKQIVKRATEKGWRASQIPDKADEWKDLLVEEDVYV